MLLEALTPTRFSAKCPDALAFLLEESGVMMHHLSHSVFITSLLAFVPSLPADDEPSPPVRVADVIGGHVHPAVCVTGEGDVLAVYNREGGGGQELLLCRSTDEGRTWSEPWARLLE